MNENKKITLGEIIEWLKRDLNGLDIYNLPIQIDTSSQDKYFLDSFGLAWYAGKDVRITMHITETEKSRIRKYENKIKELEKEIELNKSHVKYWKEFYNNDEL